MVAHVQLGILNLHVRGEMRRIVLMDRWHSTVPRKNARNIPPAREVVGVGRKYPRPTRGRAKSPSHPRKN